MVDDRGRRISGSAGGVFSVWGWRLLPSLLPFYVCSWLKSSKTSLHLYENARARRGMVFSVGASLSVGALVVRVGCRLPFSL